MTKVLKVMAKTYTVFLYTVAAIVPIGIAVEIIDFIKSFE